MARVKDFEAVAVSGAEGDHGPKWSGPRRLRGLVLRLYIWWRNQCGGGEKESWPLTEKSLKSLKSDTVRIHTTYVLYMQQSNSKFLPSSWRFVEAPFRERRLLAGRKQILVLATL